MERSLKKLYKQIVSLSKGSAADISWDSDSNEMFRLDDEGVCTVLNPSPDVVSVSLKRLEAHGYIEWTIGRHVFRLTYKGLHPYEVRWEETKSFLLKSVLVPILVSISAAIITAWLYLQLNLDSSTLPPS